MLTLTVRSIAPNRYRLVRYFVLCLCCLLPNSSLHAQVEGNDAALEKIHRRLTNVERLKYHKPIVFVGEISALGPVFRGVCKSAVNESVDFTISRLLFGQFFSVISTVSQGTASFDSTSLPFLLRVAESGFSALAVRPTCSADQ